MSFSKSNQENTVFTNQNGTGNNADLKKVNDIRDKAKAEVAQGPKKIISCNLCNTNFATVQFLSKHFLSGVHGIEKCKLCDKPFSSVKTLVQHFVSDDHSAQINANKSANVNNVGKFKFVPSKGFFKNPQKLSDKANFNEGTPIKRKLDNVVNSGSKKIRTDPVISDTSQHPISPSVPVTEFTPNFVQFTGNVVSSSPISVLPFVPTDPISALPFTPITESTGALISASPEIPTTISTATNQELSMDGQENHWIETMITKVENCLENCENLVGKVRDEWIDEISVNTTTKRLRNVLKFAINNFKMIDKTINDQVSLWSKEAPKPAPTPDNPDSDITCTPDIPEIPCTPSYGQYMDSLFDPNKKADDKSNYEIKKEIIDYNADKSISEQPKDSSNKTQALSEALVKKEIVTPEKIDNTKSCDSEIFHSESEILNEETIRKQEEILARMKQVFEAAKGKVPSSDPAPEKSMTKNNEDSPDIPQEQSVDNIVDKTVSKSTNKTVNEFTDRTVDESPDKTASKSLDSTVDQSTDKSVDQSYKTPHKSKDLLLSKAMDEILRSASLETSSDSSDNNVERDVDGNINIKKELLTPEKQNLSENKDNQLVPPNEINENNNQDNDQTLAPKKADKNNELSSNSQNPSKETTRNSHLDTNVVETLVGSCHSLQDYLKRILKNLQKLDTDRIFAKPVDVNTAPDYDEIIKNPMDFSKMRRKLKHLKYSSIGELEADFCLMIKNCLRYNSKDTIYHKSATEIFDKGVTIINFISDIMKKSLNAAPMQETSTSDNASDISSKENSSELSKSEDSAKDSSKMSPLKDSLKTVSMKDSSKLSPLKDSLKPKNKYTSIETKKYNTRSRRSLNNSEKEVGPEPDIKKIDPKQNHAAKEDTETISVKKCMPKLRIKESKNLILGEEVAKDSNDSTKKVETDLSNNIEIKEESMTPVKEKLEDSLSIERNIKDFISDKKLKKKSALKVPKNKGPKKCSDSESSPEKPSKNISKNTIIDKKYSESESSPEKTPQKVHKKKVNKKYNISPRKSSESESSPEVSPIKKSKKVFKGSNKIKLKSSVKVNNIKKKKIKKLKESEVQEKAVSTLKNALSNTIEEKAFDLLKNALMKFTESDKKETKSVKKSTKNRKMSNSKNTEENFMNNLIKKLQQNQ